MKDFLKKNRNDLIREMPDIRKRKFFSPATYSSFRMTVPLIEQHVCGGVIDIGCGDMPYKAIIESKADFYHGLDLEKRAEGIRYIGDVQDMSMISDGTYDTAVCFEVLEHVPDPFQAVREIARILKEGGSLIVSVPHLSRLHELPHDYYRYTSYGLKEMLERNGFTVVTIAPTGSWCGFLGHQVSSVVNTLFWRVPVLKWVVFYLNILLCVLPCYLIDRYLLKRSLFPLGHVCLARKN